MVTARQVRDAVEGRGLIDLAPQPAKEWHDRQRALQLRAHFARVARPWNPRGTKVPLSDASDRLVRRCFSRCGYGAGFSGNPMMCHVTMCEFADECYQALRAVVEATDPRAAEFNRRHRQRMAELRADGDAAPGQKAVLWMKAQGFPLPLEDAVRANEELGRLDQPGGTWARCSSCERVPMRHVMVEGKCPRCAKEAGLA